MSPAALRHAPRRTVIALVSLLSGACGYIGAPLPPALNFPSRVTDLAAVQRGSKIVIHFTMPKTTTEAMPLKSPPEVDLRVGVSGPQFDQADWLRHSRSVVGSSSSGYEMSTAGFEGKDVVVAVRLLNDRGKDAGWSNFVALPIAAPLSQPQNLIAQAVPQGVELRWEAPSRLNSPLAFRVYRKGQTGDFAPLGEVTETTYVDNTAEFGKTYVYFVQSVQKVGSATNQSEISENVTIAPKDTFPPGVPSNLKAIVGTRSVEISWDRNTESDLAGYRLYRAEGDGPWAAVAGSIVGAGYSDRDIKPGRYRYSVSSIDGSGNESARSAPIDVTVP